MLNILRKVSVIAVNVFVPQEDWMIKLGVGFAFLIIYLRVQIILHPWWSEVHSNLEQREIICSICTLYTAVYFNNDTTDTSSWGTIIILIFVILANVHFFTMIIFCFMRIPNFSKFPKFFQKYELWYLKYVKIMRYVSLTSWTTTLRLKDDPMSTSFASTERITTGFIK